MSAYYITEAVKQSKGRKYKCPYCDKRDYKPKLVDHIDNEHPEMIPEGYTAARVVFNVANKKDHGTCVCGCGRETSWREDLWRYDRYATPECIEKYTKEMKARMVRVHGKEHLLNDENMQNKMLKGRSISGTYKFSKGGKLDYVGSYEKQFLQFCDKVMNYRASDIEQPGPVIDYEYNGETHKWITDFYIPSANLVLDIKDGGDNPNNREMESYREKQKCKEAAIINQEKYNYIRLTDNKFNQLMLALVTIKERLNDSGSEYKPVIKINEGLEFTLESTQYPEYTTEDAIVKDIIECIIGVAPGGRRINETDPWVINYMNKNTFEMDQAFSVDHPDFNRIIAADKDGNIGLYDKSLIDNTYCEMYRYNGVRYKQCREPKTLFEMITGSEIIDPEQLAYDERFERVYLPSEDTKVACVEATMIGSKDSIPCMTSIAIKEEFIQSYIDNNGIYIENTKTHLRSKSYMNENYIPKEVIEYIRGGEI